MNHFLLTLNYSFRRLLADKAVFLLVIIPMGLIVINSLATDPFAFEGYNVTASMNMPAFLLAFQFFNMGIMLHFLYHDFRGDMRWRLRAAPHSVLSFILPVFTASWLFSIGLGLLIILLSAVFLNAYLGNLLVLAAVIVLISLLANFLAMLLFLLIDKFGLANTLVYVISFGFMIMSGFMFPLGDSALAEFITTHVSPLGLGVRAIMYAGSFNDLSPAIGITGGGMRQALINMGILAAATAALACVTILVARWRKI